jgi:2,4-dienoyl-CoA reductase-like NADH-dependent reductase (Old Yellow Enzyme family)
MADLLEASCIKHLELNNRFVRSATWEGLATADGFVTPRLIDVMTDLARGGIGLIITGHAYVSREGQATPWQLGAYSDVLIPGLSGMAEAVHASGGKILLQLAHAGSQADCRLTGVKAIGPSVTKAESGPVGSEMGREDIIAVGEAFAAAAVRARIAGFDGVQLHGAHGYLLSQFLSPVFNKRHDNYGGGLRNRTRFVVDVLKAVRSAAGPEFHVSMKINSEDFLPGGFSVKEMVETCLTLQEAGIDAIEMSGGTPLSGAYVPSRKKGAVHGGPEAYYEDAARKYKEALRVPLVIVGGIRSFETAERLVREGLVDYVAFSRPLIREPDLVNRWKSGDRRPALCVSDNGCFKPGFKRRGVVCVLKEREGSDL